MVNSANDYANNVCRPWPLHLGILPGVFMLNYVTCNDVCIQGRICYEGEHANWYLICYSILYLKIFPTVHKMYYSLFTQHFGISK